MSCSRAGTELELESGTGKKGMVLSTTMLRVSVEMRLGSPLSCTNITSGYTLAFSFSSKNFMIVFKTTSQPLSTLPFKPNTAKTYCI